MKLLLVSFFTAFFFLGARSQDKKNEGVSYFLPKTQLNFILTIEKSVYKPGDCAAYADLFMKKKAETKPKTLYRIIKIDMALASIPDSAKQHTLTLDKKHSIISLKLANNGVLTSINAEPKKMPETPFFMPAAKPKAIEPRDYLSAEALSAGSITKMAEVIARDVYELRENRKMLASGEAEYMPKDGEQLKTMLSALEQTEKALMCFFEGTITKDTLQQVVTFVPEKSQSKALLFRFSNLLGLVDTDNLAGIPHYINIEDLNTIANLKTNVDGDKKAKEDIGLYVNLAGQIRVSVDGEYVSMNAKQIDVAQFGKEEMLSGSLFNKKFTSHIVINPITGNVESLNTEPLE